MNNQYKQQLSILIPVYNHVCVNLIQSLHIQAEELDIEYEIIVADDGSTDKEKIETNTQISNIPKCEYISRQENVGRAAIRNYLAARSKFDKLLFMDCDIELPDNDFLKKYIDIDTVDTVIYGGVCTEGTLQLAKHNIRYIYEHAEGPNHLAKERNKRPYKSFRTTNFMIARSIMTKHPFDERFRYYGYEDVFFGKKLKDNGIVIHHIDNPVVIKDFEPNDVFIAKTEESMRTLHTFRDELKDYSTMLGRIAYIRHFIPLFTIRVWHRLFSG